MVVEMRARTAAMLVLAVLSALSGFACGCQGTQELMTDTGRAIHHLIDRPDVAEAARAVKSPDPDIRRQAVLELGRGGVRDVETLRDVLALLTLVLQDDGEPMVRAAAASSLGYWKQQAATTTLVAALKDDSDMVRQEVVRALAKIRDPDAVPALIVTLEMDPSADVRSAAAEALGGFEGDDVLRVLVEALDDQSLSVRYAASRSLGRLTGKDYGLDKERWAQWLASSGGGFEEE